MSTIEEGIEIEVPARTAYNQWTQFEEFPLFMHGVESVTQRDDTHLHWVAQIGGSTREWDAEITEQVPDERIAWRSLGGQLNAGVVTFHYLDENRCKVMLQMEYDPQDFAEKVADTFNIVRARVTGDLQRFKDFIEARGSETGAWRGEVKQRKLG